MAASAVSICSNAAVMLGDAPFSSFSDPGDKVRAASNLWPSVRDYVLRSHPWNCATKRVVLSPDAEAPAFDWAYQYSLPGDYLRTLSVGERGIEDEFRIESGKLLCDNNPVRLRYIWRNDNPASYDPMLVHALEHSMRAVLAFPLTQSGSMEQLVESVLRPILQRARAVDGQDSTSIEVGDSPLLTVRYNSAGGTNKYRSG